jgi:hypothetical protein
MEISGISKVPVARCRILGDYAATCGLALYLVNQSKNLFLYIISFSPMMMILMMMMTTMMKRINAIYVVLL